MAAEATEPYDPYQGHSPTVTWFELFYDLVVVASVGLTNDVFLDRPTWQNAVLAAVTMAALAWVWFLTTLFNNLFPGQDLLRRALLLAQMAAIAIAGLAIDQDHGIDNRIGLLAYAAALAIVGALITWGARSTPRRVRLRVIGPIAIAAAICVVGAIDDHYRSGLYLVAALLVSMLPILLMQYSEWREESMIRLDHLRERLGLFVLIILGEGFAQLVSALHFLGTIPRADLFALLFVLSFAVWWIYFDGTFSDYTDLVHVRWRLTLLAHLTLIFGIVGTVDVLVLLAAGEATELGDEALAYFVICLSLVLLSFAALTFTAKGRLGVQGWLQLACGLLIVSIGLVLVPRDDTSTNAVILLSAAVVIGNAVIAVWADANERRHEWRSSLGVAFRGTHEPRTDREPPMA
ncbi:MAG: low temperature requirement protein A [Actinomycetes bacterium]